MTGLKHGDFFTGVAMWVRAAHLAGMRSLFGAEINKDRVKVTARNFPDLVQVGDISKVDGTTLPPVDVISFSSPCQDLSLAGKREGFQGERSSLFFEAMRVIWEMREATNGRNPKIIVWENVPGAFSSNKGQDFRAVLQEIAQSEIPMPQSGRWATAGMVRGNGCTIAWRVMDAQYWGVPQRRRRIFLVASFGSECAAEILFEPESLPGHLAESGEAGQEVAAAAGSGATGAGRAGCYRLQFCDANGVRKDRVDGGLYCFATETHHCLNTHPDNTTNIAPALLPKMGTGGNNVPIVPTLNTAGGGQRQPYIIEMTSTKNTIVGDGICPTLTARMGTGGNQVNAVFEPVAFGPEGQGNIAHALRSQASKADKPSSTTYVIEAYDPKDLGRREATFRDVSPTLKARMGTGGNNTPCVRVGYIVRRLTETECERLQGMPDGWTAGISMSARYFAIGDSLAGPCVNWIMKQVAKYLREGA